MEMMTWFSEISLDKMSCFNLDLKSFMLHTFQLKFLHSLINDELVHTFTLIARVGDSMWSQELSLFLSSLIF